jgi:hypothetical protein
VALLTLGLIDAGPRNFMSFSYDSGSQRINVIFCTDAHRKGTVAHPHIQDYWHLYVDSHQHPAKLQCAQNGRATARAVSRLLLNTETRVKDKGVRMTFVADRMATWQFPLQVLRFLAPNITPPLLHIHSCHLEQCFQLFWRHHWKAKNISRTTRTLFYITHRRRYRRHFFVF